MKLHLPSSLRTALLSCFGAVAFTLCSGSLMLPMQAVAATGTSTLALNSTVSTYTWDAAWGDEENAQAPENLPSVRWTTVAEKPGLAFSPFYDKNGVIAAYVTGGTVTGNAPHVNQIIGGAYGTQPIDPTGGTIDRDIWLAIGGGSYEVVGGGNFSLVSTHGEGGADAAWNLVGDTHVQISSTATIGSVIGSNVSGIENPTHVGNSYISVYTRQVEGSIVGSGYQTNSQQGDTNVFVYAPLYKDEETVLVDRTLSDHADGFNAYTIDANAVIGGILDGSMAHIQGNTNLTFDFANAGGTMVKNLVGGHFGQIQQTQSGNTAMNIQHVKGSSFKGLVVGGHYLQDADHVTQSREGNTDVHISDAGYAKFSENIVAGHYYEIDFAGFPDYAYSQNLTGDVSLTVENAPRIIIQGNVLTAGHYAQLNGRVFKDNTAQQTQTGNTKLAFADIGSARISSLIVGGHYLQDNWCDDHPDQHPTPNDPRITHDKDTHPVQQHSGTVDISISRAEGAVFIDSIVAGHYLTGSDTEKEVAATLSHQTQQGDVNLTIDNSRASYAGLWLIGGHYADVMTDDTTTMRHTDGDIHITIGNGSFRNQIVLGDVHVLNLEEPEDHDPDPVHNADNMWDSVIEGSTNLTVTGGTFNGIIVGCSASNSAGRANVGSVRMDLSNAVFNTAIVGGFYSDAITTVGDIDITFTNATVNADVYGGTATQQGNITLTLHGGTFKGNIYAGGMKADQTASTTVSIDDDVQFNRTRVSGGFSDVGDSAVTGAKTLIFASAGSTYANTANATFTEFDTVNVAAADTTVTLRQNLQLMGQHVTKTGEGTLVLYKDNEIDKVTVQDGTLRLAGNSSQPGGTMIEHLTVKENGTLDISAGNCGINGVLTLSQGAGLAVRVNQGAAVVTDLNWDGPVTLSVLDATAANVGEDYEIKLFGGLSESHINGLALSQIEGISGLAAVATNYIDSVLADGAYIVLREDGTLVLSAKERQSAYWLEGSGEWNSDTNRWYGQETASGAPDTFRDGARTVFVGNSTPADVQIAEDVAPYSMTVKDGTFTFASAADKTLSLKSDLVLEHADATFNNEVKFGELSNISVDATSALAMNGNDEVTVFDVDNAGTINVADATLTVTDALRNSGSISAAAMELAQGTQQGGTVTANSLKLGGDSTFDSVTAKNIEVPTTLTVVHDLAADSLTLAGNTGGSPAPFVTAGSVTTISRAATMDIAIDNGVLLSNKALVANGGEFYVLRSDDIRCDFTLNGAALSPMEEGRYHYDFTVDSRGLKVSSTVISTDHFAGMAGTENGKAAAAMVDSLFAPGSTALANPTGDLALLVHSLNTLDAAHDCAALEQLATAAAGASLPSLGLAVGNDMERQLRAIRNRTTTMGVDQTVSNEAMPYFNAWVNAEGDYRSVKGDNTEAGYTMSSFGGTVGFDADVTPHFTCGLALTAMHGKYTSDDIDNADGNVTTEYLSVFARYARHAWTHTFVASAGIAQADIDRTVNHAGGSYSTSGSTNGTAFGLMYEVGHVSALNAEGSVCIQPFANVSFVHANLSGFDEEGSDAALSVDDMTYNAATFGLGARLQGLGGETIYNRSAIYELRALAKLHAGDRSVEADTHIAQGTPGTLHSAEVGAFGAEIGAGITLPVGGQSSSVFADVSVELNSAYTQVNGTIGYRINF